MKAFAGFTFFLLFLAGIIFTTMLGNQSAQKNMLGGGASLTGVPWRVARLGDELVPADSGMFVNFEVDGSIRGNGGCNTFRGSLVQSQVDLTVSPLMATRMVCPSTIMDREDEFLRALQSMRQFHGSGDKLQLLDENDQVLIEFVVGAQQEPGKRPN